MVAVHVFSSTGIGVLIGILLGLSASPVVGMVVGAVTAMLTSLIGTDWPAAKTPTTEPAERDRQQRLMAVRAGCFGLACVMGIFSGIYMRTHHVLSPPQPTMKEQFDAYRSIGFSAQQARSLVAGKTPTAHENSPSTSDTVLFAVDADSCEKMNIDNFATLDAAADYYRNADMPKLADATDSIRSVVANEADQRHLMQSVVEALCAASD